MAITSLDILNLSHSLKDICEVNCNTPECLSQALKLLMQYNLIQANLQFSRQFCQAADAPACLPTAPVTHTPASPATPCGHACFHCIHGSLPSGSRYAYGSLPAQPCYA